MDLKDMLYFCTIVEEGQISKAAKRLNISQPPLSLRLKELEEEVGCSLISRANGKWKVTKEGQLLYHKSQQILSHIEGLAESIRNIGSEFSGEVRIGIGAHCMSYFQRIVPDLIRKYPRISCRTVVADSPTIERYLQERSIELAVLRLNLSHNCYTTFNLPPQHMVAVYSNLLPPPSHEGQVTFEELVQYPLLFSRRWANADGFRPIVAAFQAKHLKPQMVLDAQLPSLLINLLYTTPAVALIPNTEIPSYAVDVFPVRDIDHYVIFQPVLAYLSDSYLSPQANAVMELIKEYCIE
ncbi:LysR family transcriptional regulator [Mailhella massiliensis]|uniref:LysR family transcriptional regulator n=1 Tax=Mailhella massiliensis TaxID=1903261 RepID=UPI002356C428|nr:LysR family transcriptional regulator [Mailhella massiliensis]